MDVLWATNRAVDPRLIRSFPAGRPTAVTLAVVGGEPAYVTATAPHYDGDCRRTDSHDCWQAVVQVWSASTGDLLRTVPDVGGEHLLSAVVGGRPVVVTSGESPAPAVVDLESGSVVPISPGHESNLLDLTLVELASGPAVVSVAWDDPGVRITCLGSGLRRVLDTGGSPSAVAVSSVDGRPVVVVGDSPLQIWDPERGQPIARLSAPWRPCRIVTWPGSALVAALSWDGEVAVYDLSTGALLATLPEVSPLSYPTVEGVLADDGHPVLAVADDEAVHLWEVGTGRRFAAPLVGPTAGCAVAAAGPGTLIAASETDEVIGVWRVTRPMTGPDPGGHPSTIRCLAIGPDGEIVAGGSDGTVAAYRSEDGSRERVVGRVTAPVNAVAAVRAAGRTLVLAGGGEVNGAHDGAVHRWFAAGPDEPLSIRARDAVHVMAAAVLRERPAVVVPAVDAVLQVADAETGEVVGRLDGRHWPDGVATGTVDGRPVVAVTTSFGPLVLWDPIADASLHTAVSEAMEPLERVLGFVQAPQPGILTVRGSRTRIRHLVAGTTLDLAPDDPAEVTAVAVHAHPVGARVLPVGVRVRARVDVGPMVAVARTDRSLTLFDATTGAALDRTALPHAATALAWTPSGDLIVAARRDLHRFRLTSTFPDTT